MLVVGSDNTWATLAANLAASSGATTIAVTTGHGARFPTVASSRHCYGTLISATAIERVKITTHGTGSDSFTVQRAVDGTSLGAFSTGDRLELRTNWRSLVDSQRWLWIDRSANVQIGVDNLGDIIRLTGSSAITQTFDAAANLGVGFMCMVVNDTTQVCTLQCAGGNTINGAATATLPIGSFGWIIGDGANALRTVGVFDFASKFDKAGGTITGAVAFNGSVGFNAPVAVSATFQVINNNIVANGGALQSIQSDVAGNGVVFLGNTAARYLQYLTAGNLYLLPGAELQVNGKTVVNGVSSPDSSVNCSINGSTGAMSIALPNQGLTPGTYATDGVNPYISITVDQKGRITAISPPPFGGGPG